MNSSNEPNAELQSLIDRLIDDRMSDDDVARLDDLLRDNPAAQQRLMEYCQFHSVLTFELHAEGVIDQFDELRKRVASNSDRRWFRGRISHRFAYAAIASIAVGLLLAVFLPWQMKPKAVLATVDGSVETPGVNVFRIESGTTQLKLAKVGSVFLQGPAELEMLSPMRARLNYGRIRMRVSDPRGYGFVVEMPNGEVKDLGTEFGVDVEDGGQNGLVVFDGEVDLRIPAAATTAAKDYVERLVRGDGVSVNAGGKLERIMAIYTGSSSTFGQLSDTVAKKNLPTIVNVRDNLRRGETRKFYEIVPHGLDEDALAYADRKQHEWNGIDAEGMPRYLIGADYVKPFNNDKMRKDFELTVTLSRPARLFVFFDDRIPTPEWLKRAFKDTGDDIGLDVGPMIGKDGKPAESRRGVGPGVDVDNHYSIWEQVVAKPGVVRLGANAGQDTYTAMYGVAAVTLDADDLAGKRESRKDSKSSQRDLEQTAK